MAVPSCYANPSPTFQRAMRLVSDITNANPAVVTTTFDHDYLTGDIVRLMVPSAYGMTQMNQLVGTISVTGTDTFSIDINSSLFDSFTTPANPSPRVRSCAHVVPVGEINGRLTSATYNDL